MTTEISNNLFSSDGHVRTLAWSGLGTSVGDASSVDAAIKLARLDWAVGQAPVQWMETDGTLQATDDFKVNYREDTGGLLGVVTRRYRVVPNHEAFSFVDHLLGEGIKIETAGSLKGGRTTWMLAKMPEQKILRDEFAPYLLLLNSHDGSRALTVAMTPIRVACWNTVNFALSEAKQRWSFRHTRNVRSKMDMANKTMVFSAHYMQQLERQAEQLATTKMSRLDFERNIEALFPMTGNEIADRRMEEKIERFRQCYHAPDVANFTGTAYGFLLATADYASHRPTKNHRQLEAKFVNAVARPADLLTLARSLFAL
jgi:phage/plasmid-like protein (TIGR03299 family)